MTLNNKKALVLFSGGQDSSVCLAWALSKYEQVDTVSFDYGQRHVVELECRARILDLIPIEFPLWGERLGKDYLMEVPVLSKISSSALTANQEITVNPHGLPTTFVPGRNIIFLSLAAAIACQREARYIIGGMCETDFSGYPDCRDDSVKAMQIALNLGMDARLVVETPLMWLDKAETWALGHKLGGDLLIQLILEETHTCYVGERSIRHSWGYGCGECPACVLRKQGYKRFRDGSSRS